MVLSLGNTRLAIGVFAEGSLDYVTRVANDAQADWEAKLAEAWGKIKGRPNAAVAAASVNPPLVDAVERAARAATGRDVNWVGRDLELPINVLTDEPAETGVDRVLNVAAAYEQIGKPCVVVDAGTAITIDVCNEKGEFLGGAIAPGVAMMLDTLHEKTAKLPRVEFEPPLGPIGKNTREAIAHGIYHGVRGMVKEIVENYATELGVWPDIIATGGDAPALFDGWELVHAVSPDLTLYGIALAFVNHEINEEQSLFGDGTPKSIDLE